MDRPVRRVGEEVRRAHLAAIIESSDDAILSKDLDGVITSWNAGATRLYGYTAEEAIGRPVSILVPDDRADELSEIMERLKSGERVDHYETVRRTKDGRPLDVSLTISPITDDEGRVIGASAIARDITDTRARKRAEDYLRESEERLRLAKAAGGLGIHDYRPPTGAIGWDARTREIWGAGEDEPITYELWLEGIHPDDRDRAEAAVQRALDPTGDGAYLVEYRVINRRDGVTRWVHVTGQATFSNGDPVRLIGTVQDITARKRTEEALREADRRKDEFLATLSHELRNPLAAIRAALSVLEDGNADPERVDRMTAIVDRQSSQLVRLIDDLLDVARITRGKVRLERRPVDVAATVREVAADFLATCDEGGIDLSVTAPEEPVVVDADPVRFAQVVNNLISNACKFTPRGGKVRVRIERDGGEVVVRVADTGIGLTHEQLDHVFEMFAQVDHPANPRTKGLGIGLSLSKSIMELHGGTIEASSEGPGRGSEFRVRIPAAGTEALRAVAPEREAPEAGRGDGGAAGAPGEDARPGRDAAGRRIVAAEDNPDALYALALMLRMKGHEVVAAVDGTEALEKAESHRPEIALLDIDMPGVDGYEVARRIRREPWGRDIVLVAMTGWGQEQDKRMALEAGFDMHMTKPVDPAALEDVLRSPPLRSNSD